MQKYRETYGNKETLGSLWKKESLKKVGRFKNFVTGTSELTSKILKVPLAVTASTTIPREGEDVNGFYHALDPSTYSGVIQTGKDLFSHLSEDYSNGGISGQTGLYLASLGDKTTEMLYSVASNPATALVAGSTAYLAALGAEKTSRLLRLWTGDPMSSKIRKRICNKVENTLIPSRKSRNTQVRLEDRV